MANVKMLRERMYASGMTVTAIAKKAGISRGTLYNKLSSGDFKVSEMLALSDVLSLEDADRAAIFFNEESE